MNRPALQIKQVGVSRMVLRARKVFGTFEKRAPGACFSKVPKLFGRHNSLCIFKTKASRGTKLCSCIYFHSLYNIWKDQLYTRSLSEFYEWLFGPEKFSGLSRNGRQVTKIFTSTLRSWRNDNAYGNDNTLIDWLRKNNRAARAARVLAQSFDVVCQMLTWNFHVWGFIFVGPLVNY